jgi:hypothetical protein
MLLPRISLAAAAVIAGIAVLARAAPARPDVRPTFALEGIAMQSPSAAGRAVTLETPFLRLVLSRNTGAYTITDRQARVEWRSNPYEARFGEVILREGSPKAVSLRRCAIRPSGGGVELTFHPLPDRRDAALRVAITPSAEGKALDFRYDADAALPVESVRLLDESLWVSDADAGYLAVPARLGLLIPADSGRRFTHRFETFAYEGCHMEMFGVVKQGAAALVSWHDPYAALEVRSEPGGLKEDTARQVLSPSLVLRNSARSFRVHFCGRGD